MTWNPTRRDFLRATLAGTGALGLAVAGCQMPAMTTSRPTVISPGCRTSKVKVAKLYMGPPKAHWPTPTLEIKDEMRRYEAEFARLAPQLADVDFAVNELVTTPAEAANVKGKLADVDGVLAIHLTMGILPMLKEVLAAGRPTMLFAAPYSGHEWTGYGALRKQPEGALLECLLTADYDQLAAAVRPFRAIHHLRQAKIVNVTTRNFDAYAAKMKEKCGTSIVRVDRQRVLDAYAAVPDKDAEAEARLWLGRAEKVVEPSRDEVFRSCKLAFALQRILDEENATAMTVDCYGSMWRKLPAYPCISHSRMNSLGLAGICESDLQTAMTQLLLQAISGRPGFVSDPTMDVSKNGIILAHCMGTPAMDGPGGPLAPYRLRTIMERQEGAVPQVRMRLGQKVTQAELIGTDQLLFFTGVIIDTPDTPRGCRTKITVKVDGDAEKLWQNWSHGLHRVTCYGDVTADLARFCRFKSIQMVNETA